MKFWNMREGVFKGEIKAAQVIKGGCSAVMLLGLSMFSAPTYAKLVNGNFDSGLSDWVTVGAVSESVGGGVAELTSVGVAPDPFSFFPLPAASLIQGADEFLLFDPLYTPVTLGAGDKFLNFDIKVESSVDSSESTSAFTDYLLVGLYNETDPYPILCSGSDPIGGCGDFTATSSWSTISLDITSIMGSTVALAFDLYDENDGFDLTFSLDNICISSTSTCSTVSGPALPEPSHFSLMSLSLLGMWCVGRRRRKA